MSVEQAIFCEAITKTYGEGEAAVKALRGIDLTANFGEIVALVGPSGCGKTTLISIFAAILSRSSGVLRLAGVDPDAMTNQERTLFR
ncbi:MAG: ATP-binding cassette domain-containing protein, partial [Phycisphaerae bacterium]